LTTTTTTTTTTSNKLLNMIYRTALASVVLLALAAPMVRAECNNACSGHGRCGAYDMCQCDRNWQGADCSQRTCPYDKAFVTTPQGDLNMDGDRNDNSFRYLSENAKIEINTNTISFENALQTNELIVGDGIKTCDQTFIVTSITDL